jgi:hypothetical protein
MTERIRDLIERLPGNEGAVLELIKSDATFDALCQEYRQTADELGRLQTVGGAAAQAEANWLRDRQSSLEEEILAKIEGYRPV